LLFGRMSHPVLVLGGRLLKFGLTSSYLQPATLGQLKLHKKLTINIK